MKDLYLGEISSLVFDNKLIIALDKRWINYFGDHPLTFQSKIKNGKFILEGPALIDSSKIDPSIINQGVSTIENKF